MLSNTGFFREASLACGRSSRRDRLASARQRSFARTGALRIGPGPQDATVVTRCDAGSHENREPPNHRERTKRIGRFVQSGRQSAGAAHRKRSERDATIRSWRLRFTLPQQARRCAGGSGQHEGSRFAPNRDRSGARRRCAAILAYRSSSIGRSDRNQVPILGQKSTAGA
jgi:hypothetical protein